METGNPKKDPPKILIVDDISMNVEILDNILSHEGYDTLCALSVQKALDLVKQTKPSLILSDLSMPEIDGLEFCRMLKANPKTRDIPFVLVSVLDTREEKEQAFLAGAVDYIPKPFDEVEVIMRVNNHLNTYRLKQEMEDYNRLMHKLVEKQTEQLVHEQEKVVLALARLIRKKDPAMGSHQQNVGYNCSLLAQGIQFRPEYENTVTDRFVETIGLSAQLHDIGRFIVQKEIPADNGLSVHRDIEEIKSCSEEGSGLLEELDTGEEKENCLPMALRIAKYCGANWNGTGYPAVEGKRIPLEARIAALADDFDTLVVKREGKDAYPIEEGVRMINEQSGIRYDPDVVEVFNKIWRQMRID